MGLLPDHTTSEVLTAGTIAGYVFAGETRGDVQELEWVLFDSFKMVHDAPMTLRPVTDPIWQHTTRQAFVDHVKSGHANGEAWQFCHARARCTAYEQARSYQLDPDRKPEDYQIEAGRAEPLVIRGPEGVIGWCYATRHKVNPDITVEHWKLVSDTLQVTSAPLSVDRLSAPISLDVTRSFEVENIYDKVPPA